jgi:membrane protease YdiL (CAAX protease family)
MGMPAQTGTAAKHAAWRAIGRAVLVLLAYVLCLPPASVLVSVGYFFYAREIEEEGLHEVTLHLEDVLAWLNGAAMFLVLLAVLACVALALRHLDGRGTFRDLGFARPRGKGPALLAAIAGGAGVMTAVFLAARGLGLVQVTDLMWRREGWADVGHDLLSTTLFLGSLVIAEELVFRGYNRFTLTGALSPRGVWLASAGLFALSRVLAAYAARLGATEMLLAALVGFVAGLVLGALYAAGDSLWLPIAARLAWSLVGAFLFSLAIAGTPMEGLLETRVESGLLTGGLFGPEGGVLGLVLLTAAGIPVCWVVRRKLWQPR